jgi:DNA replication protein DnaC
MMDDQDQIVNNLKSLHMPTIRRSYEDVADQARAESWGYEKYLSQLLTLECEVRWQNRISRNLRASKLPPSKTFENFDKNRLPSRVANHLSVLVNGSFLDRCENILAFGNPGKWENPSVMCHWP